MNFNRKGQTLLETMIALAMVVSAFLGIGALLARSFFLNRVATNETIATYLAAEGIEITKNIIDHDVYDPGSTWGTHTPPGGAAYCPIYNTQDLHQFLCSLLPSQYLKYDSVTGEYQYTTGKTTEFKRSIIVTQAPQNPNELQIQSTVQWGAGPLSDSVTEVDNFYDWHANL